MAAEFKYFDIVVFYVLALYLLTLLIFLCVRRTNVKKSIIDRGINLEQPTFYDTATFSFELTTRFEDVTQSSWKGLKILLCVYRFTMLVFFLGFAVILANIQSQRGIYFLTNWNSVIVTAYFLVAFTSSIISIYYQYNRTEDDLRMGGVIIWSQKVRMLAALVHMCFEIAGATSLFVVMFDNIFLGDEDINVLIQAVGILTVLALTLELILSTIRVRFDQYPATIAYTIVYLLFMWPSVFTGLLADWPYNIFRTDRAECFGYYTLLFLINFICYNIWYMFYRLKKRSMIYFNLGRAGARFAEYFYDDGDEDDIEMWEGPGRAYATPYAGGSGVNRDVGYEQAVATHSTHGGVVGPEGDVYPPYYSPYGMGPTPAAATATAAAVDGGPQPDWNAPMYSDPTYFSTGAGDDLSQHGAGGYYGIQGPSSDGGIPAGAPDDDAYYGTGAPMPMRRPSYMVDDENDPYRSMYEEEIASAAAANSRRLPPPPPPARRGGGGGGIQKLQERRMVGRENDAGREMPLEDGDDDEDDFGAAAESSGFFDLDPLAPQFDDIYDSTGAGASGFGGIGGGDDDDDASLVSGNTGKFSLYSTGSFSYYSGATGGSSNMLPDLPPPPPRYGAGVGAVAGIDSPRPLIEEDTPRGMKGTGNIIIKGNLGDTSPRGGGGEVSPRGVPDKMPPSMPLKKRTGSLIADRVRAKQAAAAAAASSTGRPGTARGVPMSSAGRGSLPTGAGTGAGRGGAGGRGLSTTTRDQSYYGSGYYEFNPDDPLGRGESRKLPARDYSGDTAVNVAATTRATASRDAASIDTASTTSRTSAGAKAADNSGVEVEDGVRGGGGDGGEQEQSLRASPSAASADSGAVSAGTSAGASGGYSGSGSFKLNEI